MKTELVKQYAHTWRVFERLVKDFDQDAWIHTGRGAMTPARLASHVLKAVKYYIEDSSTTIFPSGKPLDCDWVSAKEEDLPSQEDILTCIRDLWNKTEGWLCSMDLSAENRSFEWAGKTRAGVVLFLLRHSLYHIGELSCLLNESRNGDVEDHYVKAL